MIRRDDFSIQVFENLYVNRQEKNPKLVINQQHRALVVSSKHHFYDLYLLHNLPITTTS